MQPRLQAALLGSPPLPVSAISGEHGATKAAAEGVASATNNQFLATDRAVNASGSAGEGFEANGK